ncbi:MAG: hypothetical protein HY064_12685 [Bacteroidetes bacterium]|nr:hypothetical protein [Bacteroidota bacterium]
MKKKFILFSIPLFFLFTSFNIIDPASLMIAVKKSQMYLNDAKLSPVWMLSDAQKELGTPDRTVNAFNNSYTYDDLGVVVFERNFGGTPSGKIKEIQVYFTPVDSNDVTPKNIFKGQFFIEKLEVTPFLKAEYLKTKMKDWTFSTSNIAHSYRYAKNGIYLYFMYTDDEQTLTKVSFGLNTVQ